MRSVFALLGDVVSSAAYAAVVVVVLMAVAGCLLISRRRPGPARHRALLAAIVENSDDAIISAGLGGRVTEWNAGAERIYGYSAAEMLGGTLADFAAAAQPADSDEPSAADVTARIAAGAGSIRYDARRIHRDGSVRDVSIVVSPILDGRRALIGVSSIARDVTAAKRLEADLRTAAERANQVQRMASLGQLAAGVAHDFNNLLGIILNYTDFAADPDADPAGVQADLAQVRAAADRAVGLTSQLLSFTRQDAVRPEDLDINAAIAETQAMLSRTLGAHIDLITLPSPAPLRIHADAGHIQQILINLAVNARDAMPQGGTLVIEAATADLDENQADLQPPPAAGRYVELLVSDTGSGMSGPTIARIFEPFFTTKPEGEGTGLGLATIYSIVVAAGGSINVYSEPGAGTTFRLYFPIVEARSEPAAALPATVPAPRGHGQTVLVVEDEPALARSVARILNEGGYRAMSANGGAQALTLHADHGCDLLLTDVVLPEMSGRRVAELITERHHGLPVLYMSGYAGGFIDTTRVLEEGMAYIEKPFNSRLLLTEIDNAFAAAASAIDIDKTRCQGTGSQIDR